MRLSQLYGNWEEAGYARPQLSETFNPERTKVEIEVEVAEKHGRTTIRVESWKLDSRLLEAAGGRNRHASVLPQNGAPFCGIIRHQKKVSEG